MTPSIAIIGLGPRGVSTLERLVAALRHTEPPAGHLTLHLIDDAQHGGGHIWDIHQPKELCMNTFAHGMTLFSEPGSSVSAPVVEGPTIYEWIQLTLGRTDNVSPAAARYVAAHPVDPQVLDAFPASQLATFAPHSYLPRALYGHYLRWVFHSVLADAPAWVTVIRHHARAVALNPRGNCDVIELNDGTTVEATATIAVTGWTTQDFTAEERDILHWLEQHPQLRWIRAASPIDQDAIRDNDTVLTRGLGMGFFDTLILSTQSRGGRFVEDPVVPWGIRYEPVGTEPTFYVSSRRGYPFLPQPDFGTLPPLSPLPRTKEVAARLAATASIDYDREVWPAVARDSYDAFLTTLARTEPEALLTPLEDARAALDAAPVEVGDGDFGLSGLDRVIRTHTTHVFSLLRWLRPIPGKHADPAALTDYLVQRSVEDLTAAEAAGENPVCAALWSLGCARKPTQVLGAEGKYTWESRRNMFYRAIALGQMACSGPPAFRTRQLLALVEAGIVRFLGGTPTLGTGVNPDTGEQEWTMTSADSGHTKVYGTTLLDAWVHKPNLRRAGDALTRSLVETGRVHPFSLRTADGSAVATASPAQDPDTRRTLGATPLPDQKAPGPHPRRGSP